MTRTILLAQEFGDGLGHVSRLVAVARGLARYRLVFAVPNREVAAPAITSALGPQVEIITDTGFAGVIQGDVDGRSDKTLADILYRLGYGDPETLALQARKWRKLLDAVRPGLVISDFAPTLRLVSCGRVPTLVLGDGFSTPPPGRPMPAIAVADRPPDAISVSHEKQLLRTARLMRKAHGGPRLGFLADLFAGERTFPITFANSDPYALLRRTPTISPFTIPDMRSGPAFAERRGPAVFCFLWATHPALNAVLTALNGLDQRSEVHVRGMDARAVVPHCAAHVGVHAHPPQFASLLPESHLFLHYGGAGATYAALLAGVTQLILPTHLEQEVTAGAMAALGVGTCALPGPGSQVDTLRATVARQLEDSAMQAAALATAAQEQARRKSDALPSILAACEQLLGQ